MSPIDTFLNNLQAPQKAELERIRQIVHNTYPEATELISYGIPSFKYKDKYLVGFCAYKNHLSLFPASRPIEVLKEKLSQFKLSKGTIQFTLDNPIPEALLKEIIKVRAQEIISS